MNNLDNVRNLTILDDNLKYGLSTLHMWIKFLECVLHISYKLEFGKTTVRGATDEQRERIKTRKEEVQTAVWRGIGVKVDRVTQGTLSNFLDVPIYTSTMFVITFHFYHKVLEAQIPAMLRVGFLRIRKQLLMLQV